LRSLELGQLDPSKFADYKLFIALFEQEHSPDPKLLRIIAITPAAFNELKNVMKNDYLELIKATGDAALTEAKSFYRTY
jgi:hypothetical protein